MRLAQHRGRRSARGRRFATAWVGLVLPGWPAIIVVLLAMMRPCSQEACGRHPRPAQGEVRAHEVITTIMMNFIAFSIVSYLTQYHYRKPGDPILETYPKPR